MPRPRVQLLRRAGWSASSADVAPRLQRGLTATLDRLFPAQPVLFPQPRLVAHLKEDVPEMARGDAEGEGPG